MASNVHDLEQGGSQSVHALIQAIAPEIANGSDGQLSSKEVATRLTDKLVEIVGSQGLFPDTGRRNERGELVNEDGLPIIEITEPVDPTDLRTNSSRPIPVVVEPLIPLRTLSDDARSKLREKRDRILDLLEEEERQYELAEKRREVQQIMEGAPNMRDSSPKDKERNKAAKELQKKMGRALLQNISKAKEQERQDQEVQRLRDEEVDRDKRKSPSIKKKSVAFAESTEHIDGTGSELENSSMGETSEAKPLKRPTLMSQALLDKHPMKLNVVERVPGGQPTITKATLPASGIPDSDDESEPEAIPDSDTEADDEPYETDEIDFDYAQQQREIALEYYHKRGIISQEAVQAMTHHDDSEMDPDTTKPTVSHFKANRLASAYGAASPSSTSTNSLAESMLAAASTRTIQKAIRSGKLNADGKLVGGDQESASEEENEGIQEVLDLLRNGGVYNLGPNGEYLDATSPTAGQSTSMTLNESSPSKSDLPPPSMRAKTSKFKLSRSAAGRPAATSPATISIPSYRDVRSASVTPISHETRSSPKMETPPTIAAAIGERNSLVAPQPVDPSSSSFSMIVDSPSFPAYATDIFSSSGTPTGSRSQRASTVQATAVQEARVTALPDQTSIPMVVESPSLVAPRPSDSRRLDRPPVIMSSTVKEAISDRSRSVDAENNIPRKVSRFKSERMS